MRSDAGNPTSPDKAVGIMMVRSIGGRRLECPVAHLWGSRGASAVIYLARLLSDGCTGTPVAAFC